MTASITFSKLRGLLNELGFQETCQPDHVTFEHAPSGTVLLFRPHEAGERLAPQQLMVVRRMLGENGLLEPQAFDRFLHRASA